MQISIRVLFKILAFFFAILGMHRITWILSGENIENGFIIYRERRDQFISFFNLKIKINYLLQSLDLNK